MENISIRRGETLELPVEVDDESALTVRFVATQDDTVYIDQLESFDDDGRATIHTNNTFIPLGEYEFTLSITYSDGIVDILPDASDCDGSCELPKLIICKSNVPEVVVS
jgi:hypothetical protein